MAVSWVDQKVEPNCSAASSSTATSSSAARASVAEVAADPVVNPRRRCTIGDDVTHCLPPAAEETLLGDDAPRGADDNDDADDDGAGSHCRRMGGHFHR